MKTVTKKLNRWLKELKGLLDTTTRPDVWAALADIEIAMKRAKEVLAREKE